MVPSLSHWVMEWVGEQIHRLLKRGSAGEGIQQSQVQAMVVLMMPTRRLLEKMSSVKSSSGRLMGTPFCRSVQGVTTERTGENSG